MSSLISNPPLGHITTFGGHPVCCAAGLASMKVLTDENLVVSCSVKSMLFRNQLKHDLISEIRGEGLLLAVKLTRPEYVRYAIAKAPEFGLVLDYFLFCDSAFRITPPLTINEEEISWACTQLGKLLDDAEKNVRNK
jgi:acetylornithine/succinyldiaminopimelate/putrescine aminotransferase